MTAQDDLALAQSIDDAANAIKSKFYKKGAAISDADYHQLQTEFQHLQMMALRVRTIAVGELLDGAQESVSSLKQVTDRATAAIKKIGDIGKVIKVATAVFTLAAAIAATVAAPNPATIVAAAQALKSIIDTVTA